MSSPLRLGLIGLGPWGERYISTIAGLKDVALARTATRNWPELLAAGGLDGVIVATPPAAHAEIAQASIKAGLPVLIEKPLTQDADQARRLLKLAQKQKALVMVDHTYLFHPAYAALKERSKTLGALRSVASIGGNLGPFRPATPPLWDYAPHDLALCLDFIGRRPVKTRAKKTESAQRPEGLGEIWEIDLEFSGGVTAHIRLGNIFPVKQRRFSALFENGSDFFDDVKKLPSASPEPLPLTRAVESFAAAVRAGSKDLQSLELGVSIVEIIEKLI